MKITSAKVNSAAIQAAGGEWQDDLPELGDVAVLVRGINNEQYSAKFEAMVAALPPSKRKNGRVRASERSRIMGSCMLEHVLLDWKNVEDAEGKPIPYSKEQAKMFLLDDDWMKFRDAVFVAATRVGEMSEEANAATEKNSAAPSATT